MCLDCGCGKLNDAHGDSRHITLDSIRSAAEASQISADEAMSNIAKGLQQAQGSVGQSERPSGASGSRSQ
jgi:hypothetical protein